MYLKYEKYVYNFKLNLIKLKIKMLHLGLYDENICLVIDKNAFYIL